MVKTSVYLDDELKADLERVVGITGRSQAELIRDGVAFIVQQQLRGQERVREVFENGRIVERIDDLLEGFGR